MKGWRFAAVAVLVMASLSGCVTPPKPAAQRYGADLVITETADRKSVAVGGKITLTITVTNRGPDEAGGIVFGSPVPVALDYVSGSCSLGTLIGSIFCEVDHLPGGKSATAHILATPIGNPTKSELGMNSVAVISEYIAFDPNRNNNRTSLAITILPETLGVTH